MNLNYYLFYYLFFDFINIILAIYSKKKVLINFVRFYYLFFLIYILFIKIKNFFILKFYIGKKKIKKFFN